MTLELVNVGMCERCGWDKEHHDEKKGPAKVLFYMECLSCGFRRAFSEKGGTPKSKITCKCEGCKEYTYWKFLWKIDRCNPNKFRALIKVNCYVCHKEICIPQTALSLCDDCFNEKCGKCGHIRAEHLDGKVEIDGMEKYREMFEGNTSCVHVYSLTHKTKRGQMCDCKEFVPTRERTTTQEKLI